MRAYSGVIVAAIVANVVSSVVIVHQMVVIAAKGPVVAKGESAVNVVNVVNAVVAVVLEAGDNKVRG